MNILILGGTQFVGRHITQAALDAGHAVTLFNRGQSNPALFPQAEKLIGDRNQDLSALRGRRWDLLIDVNAYFPRQVRAVLATLADSIAHYTLISTISTYADLAAGNAHENSPLATLDDEATEEITGETYGGLKVLCERAAQKALPDRCLIIRPGLVVGAHDHTNRFRYWLTRAAAGGQMLAPSSADFPLQVIDARDLARFTLMLATQQSTGIYNATSRPHRLGDVLHSAKDYAGADTLFTWVDEAFLLNQGIQPFTSLPFWVPMAMAGVHSINIDRALAAGLEQRPLADTVAYALAWEQIRSDDTSSLYGISRERELEILAAWQYQRSA